MSRSDAADGGGRRRHRPDPIEAFRRRTGARRRPGAPLPLREKLVLAGLSAQVVFSSWFLGGASGRVQVGMAVLAALGALLLFVPLPEPRGLEVRSSRPFENLGALLRFPPFWFGLGLCAYVAVQGWNVEAEYHLFFDVWFLETLPYVEWLPSGLRTPFEIANPWRRLLLFAPAWAAGCTLWVGLRHRRATYLFLTVVAFNAAALAGTAVLQHVSGTADVLWFYPAPPQKTWGPFLYTNHAGAYLNLGLAVTLALALYHLARTQRTLAKSGPQLLFLVLGCLVAGSVVGSLSRGAILIAALLLGAFCLLGLATLFSGYSFRSGATVSATLLVLVGLLGGGLYLSIDKLDKARLAEEFANLEETLNSPGEDARFQLNYSTSQMLRDRWVFGWGAGSYFFRFPIYQKRNPHLDIRRTFGRDPVKRPIAFLYSHNDYLQYPVELGAAGCGFIVLALLWSAAAFLRHRRQLRPYLLMLAAGPAALSLHASFDFVFFNPATVLATVLVLAATLRTLQSSARRHLEPPPAPPHPPRRG